MQATSLSAGLSLKPEHFDEALAARAGGLWFEVHPENYMVDGGPRLAWLEAIRQQHPLSLHGVSLSLAGPDALDAGHLCGLAAMVRRFQPALVSDHLAWSRIGANYLPDLLPAPRTDALLRHLLDRIDTVQNALGRPLAVENPSHYLRLPHTWDETEFLRELARRSGCGLLLDINNVHVSAHNLGFDAADYLDRFPAEAVMEIHLAGHTQDPALGEALLVDTHDTPVAEAVWSLYQRFIERAGPRPTLIERDGNVPAFTALMDERTRANAVATAAALARRTTLEMA